MKKFLLNYMINYFQNSYILTDYFYIIHNIMIIIIIEYLFVI